MSMSKDKKLQVKNECRLQAKKLSYKVYILALSLDTLAKTAQGTDRDIIKTLMHSIYEASCDFDQQTKDWT
jgi:hypothetical protein